MAVFSIICSLLMCRGPLIYVISALNIAVVIVLLVIIHSRKVKYIFFFEGLQGLILLFSLASAISALIIGSGGHAKYKVFFIAVLVWIITAVIEVILTRRRIRKGYYALNKIYKSNREDLLVVVAPGCYLAYKLGGEMDSTVIFEGFLILFLVFVIKIVESFMMHYYVNKYDLEDKIRIGDVRT
ncbi:MAG: hypothetical protein Q4A65_00165 [Bacillota bacterium]|nr:hypothetical protein [Bacillota bacterium]